MKATVSYQRVNRSPKDVASNYFYGETHERRDGKSTEATAIRHLQEIISLRAIPNANSGRWITTCSKAVEWSERGVCITGSFDDGISVQICLAPEGVSNGELLLSM